MTHPSPMRGKSRPHVAATWQQRRSNVRGRTMADRHPRADAIGVAAIEALFASVNPAVSKGKDLQEALTKAIDAVASVQNRSASLRRVLYPSLAKLFTRMKNGSGVPQFDIASLKVLLFGTDAEVEAVRLLRADAIVAVTNASRWLAEEMKPEVEALRASEPSQTVLGRLPTCR